MSTNYKSAGVDVEAGYESVALIGKHCAATFNKHVLSNIGGFGGMFDGAVIKDMNEPVLISGTDGVGTKLKIAFLMDRHDTIGIDCVAMCVNDIICVGAKPLFFLDYIACGKNYPNKIEQIVKGLSVGCIEAGAALIGGETAEHPDLMPCEEYDLAGFCVGVVDKPNVIDGSKIEEGDALIGILSSGLHSNGFSLVRRILKPSKETLNDYIDEFGTSLGDELLKPTRIYVKSVIDCISKVSVKGIAHITGGGFYENIPRILNKKLTARIAEGSWPVPKVFNLISERGAVEKRDMYSTFNMGIGMVVAVSEKDAGKTISILEENGERAYKIGEVINGGGEVLI